MRTFHEFATTQEARDYRHEHGTGGWIFAPGKDQVSPVILFPPDMTPIHILTHRMTKGLCGTLIG